MKRLLIVNFAQFGYHTDTYFYCRYLRNEYAVTYLCWDYGRERVVEEGIAVRYVSREGTRAGRAIRFLGTALNELRVGSYDVVVAVYFHLCSLLRLSRKYRTIVMDVRTGYVMRGMLRKLAHNWGIWLESQAFPHVTVITEEVRRKLHISRMKCHILPVGAEQPEVPDKVFDSIRLLYVGTFTNRDIHKTVEGFDRFASEQNGTLDVTYDIVGSGDPAAQDAMLSAIRNARAGHLIRYHGRVPHKNLTPLFAQCNIGIAFVPLREVYQMQPVTKVFEYLLAGMPVLATATMTNTRIITPANGILFADTAQGVYEALRQVAGRLPTYSSRQIKNESAAYSWERVINGNLRPYLHSLANL